MSGQTQQRRHEVRTILRGFITALILSMAAFGLVHWKIANSGITAGVVFGLALIQMIVHFRFFLKISLNRSSRDDLVLILFSSLIIVLMVSGTLVLLLNLHQRMM